MKRVNLWLVTVGLLFGAVAGHWIVSHPTVVHDVLLVPEQRLKHALRPLLPRALAHTVEPGEATTTPDANLRAIAEAAAYREYVVQERDTRVAVLRRMAQARSTTSSGQPEMHRIAREVLELNRRLGDADTLLSAALQRVDDRRPERSRDFALHFESTPTSHADVLALLEQIALAGRPVAHIEELVVALKHELRNVRVQMDEQTARLQRDVERLLALADEQEARVRALRDEKAKLMSETRAVQDQAKADLQEARQRTRALTLELGAAERRLEQARDKLRRAEASSPDDGLRALIATQAARLTEAETLAEALRRKNTRLESELQTAEQVAEADGRAAAHRIRALSAEAIDASQRCAALERRAQLAEEGQRRAEHAAAAREAATIAERTLAQARAEQLRSAGEVRTLRAGTRQSALLAPRARPAPPTRSRRGHAVTGTLQHANHGEQTIELAEGEVYPLSNGLTLELLDDDSGDGVKVRVSDGRHTVELVLPLREPATLTNHSNGRKAVVVAVTKDLPHDRARFTLR